MGDKQLGVLKDRAVAGVGIKYERRVRDVLLKDERVDARYHDVVVPVHDQDRALDFLELAISFCCRHNAPRRNGGCLGAHCRHRGWGILIDGRVATLPKSAPCRLACLAGRKEKVEKIIDDRSFLGRMLSDFRRKAVHVFSALWSGSSEDYAAD